MIVCLVTDRRRLAGAVSFDEARRCLLTQAQYAIEAGVDSIILRERDLEARDQMDLTRTLVQLARGTSTRVLVSDRVDVALAARADGVHLRADSMPADVVRRITPGGFLIGRSVHSVDEAASAGNVDYLIAGTVWTSRSKPEGHGLLGIAGFTAVVRASAVPVLAIGGVTLDNVREVAAAGGAGIAAIGLFMGNARQEGCAAIGLRETADHVRSRFDTSGSAS